MRLTLQPTLMPQPVAQSEYSSTARLQAATPVDYFVRFGSDDDGPQMPDLGGIDFAAVYETDTQELQEQILQAALAGDMLTAQRLLDQEDARLLSFMTEEERADFLTDDPEDLLTETQIAGRPERLLRIASTPERFDQLAMIMQSSKLWYNVKVSVRQGNVELAQHWASRYVEARQRLAELQQQHKAPEN